MTVRDCYEACLIELNKVLAPSLLIDDFVYLLNKNIQEYFNKRYISFEKIQQNTDDLRHLINLLVIEVGPSLYLKDSINGKIWECKLPSDYVHILGCRAVFDNNSRRCKTCTNQVVGVNKLDTNQAPLIGSNWYMRPSHNRPYYLIINIQLSDGELTPDHLYNSGSTPNSEKTTGKRYGNSTLPMMLILCGDDPKHLLKSIEISYLQAPRYVSLDQDDLDSVQDNSSVMEFSDYVCNEIIKQLVTSILENQKNDRLQTYIPINQSIPQN